MQHRKKYYQEFIKYAWAVSVAFFLLACTYNNEEELYGNLSGACDTTEVSYASDVLPLLQSNCYGCHSQAASLGGVNLEGHNRVKSFADNGRLLGTISHAAGFSPMPKNGSKLPDCEIDKIRSWINAGTPNN